MEKLSIMRTLKGWVMMSRPPFHTVGVFPFILGTLLAYRIHGVFHAPVFVWGVIAVILIMLSAYYNGEYCDIVEDRILTPMGRSIFHGGSGIVATDVLSYKYAKIAGYITLILAVFIGLIIQFYYKTGPLTIPLGIIGILSGFFYSKMPLRWVAKGIGEILIGICYGWLPVAVSFYIQLGMIDSVVHYVSLPIACTIFNVILINEFPDYHADLIAKKNHLVIRIGKEKAAYLYILITAIACVSYVLSIKQGIPSIALILYAPIFIISLIAVLMMLGRKYRERRLLEIMCGLTIVTNIGTTLSYIIALWWRGM
jgi:1,4-dihydroxy-2-naphthoate octaprenyltransferase